MINIRKDTSKGYKIPKKKYQAKKFKGDKYEKYIAEHYRQLGCDVIEHGLEKGLKDGGIDLIAILGNEVILVQCKDWNENYSHKIDHKDIKVLRTDANDFLEKNPIYKNCKIKLRYTLSGDFLHKSALKYIETCKEDIDYEIIKPTYTREEQLEVNHTKKSNQIKYIKENKNIVKVIFILVFFILVFFLTTIKKPKIVETHIPNKIIVTSTNNTLKDEKKHILKTQKEDHFITDTAIKLQSNKSTKEKAKAILLMQMKN